MSSAPVRDAFRAAWDSFAPGVSYFDVVNKPVRLGGAEWRGALLGTLTFAVAERSDQTFGSSAWVEERGTVTISIFVPSGSSDEAAIAKATEIQRRLAGRLLADDLLVSGVFGPIDEQPEGAGEFYQVQLGAEYVWQAREARLNPGNGG